jgi:hypothetical protein
MDDVGDYPAPHELRLVIVRVMLVGIISRDAGHRISQDDSEFRVLNRSALLSTEASRGLVSYALVGMGVLFAVLLLTP